MIQEQANIYHVRNETLSEHVFGDLKYYSFNIFDKFDCLKSGYTTRHGGVSKDFRSTLNFSDTVGDEQKNIEQNFKNLGDAIGIDSSNMVCSDQTHTTNLLVVDSRYKGEGVVRPRSFCDIDGLITNENGLCLVTTYADCVPLYFLDPKNKVIAMSHSGWKGTVNQIGSVTVSKLKEVYNTKPSDLICAIGPSICQDCYEVSLDVIEQFKKAYDRKYWDELFYEKGNGKFQLSLWNACKITLLEAGVKSENIAVTNICTCCNPKEFHSHRASKGKRGNNAGFMCLI